MNPCPCWYLTDPDKECQCKPNQIKNYSSRLSWPLLDRIDIFIEVPKVKTNKFKSWDNYQWQETSLQIQKRVSNAKSIQIKRFSWTSITSNSEMTTKEINKYCFLEKDTESILKQAVNTMNLSARAYYRILKLARTIADLDAITNIETKHILEALRFRKKED